MILAESIQGFRLRVLREAVRSGNGGCGGDRDLLAKDRSHRQFERVPGACRADAWVRVERPLEQRLAAKLFRDHRRIGADVEHPPGPLNDGRQLSQATDRHFQQQCGPSRVGGDRHGAGLFVNRDGSLIAPRLHIFDTRCGSSGQECHHCLPVVRRSICQPNPMATPDPTAWLHDCLSLAGFWRVTGLDFGHGLVVTE